ncbi:hypothetical protein [Thalassospira lohafexi]|uniref:Uncharacterized protein n=1 Tax=Thalassospira lohafexi TaxID=744227 RepID=A0A2N3L407_9PROT|nr:hypothetical protein [Thalassospira lohafexi]PKR57437.1 hypothetical protein COO92_15945 [Thalassospira lohafexi]
MEKKQFHPKMTHRKWFKLIGLLCLIDVLFAIGVYGWVASSTQGTSTLKLLQIPITILVLATLASVFLWIASILHSVIYAFFARRSIHSATDRI